MPCYTVQTVSVVLKVADLDILFKALEALDLRPQRQSNLPNMIFFGSGEMFDKATGELRIRAERSVAKIKQAYSAEIVKAQAKKYGWQIKETAPFQFAITKR